MFEYQNILFFLFFFLEMHPLCSREQSCKQTEIDNIIYYNV